LAETQKELIAEADAKKVEARLAQAKWV
jgi:hypothetical protein